MRRSRQQTRSQSSAASKCFHNAALLPAAECPASCSSDLLPGARTGPVQTAQNYLAGKRSLSTGKADWSAMHQREVVPRGQRASTLVVRPPRGVNSPRTTHQTGLVASTISRKMRLTENSKKIKRRRYGRRNNLKG